MFGEKSSQPARKNTLYVCLPHCAALFYWKLRFSIIRQMPQTASSLTHSHRHIQCCQPYFGCFCIVLDFLYGFATLNLIRKQFLMVGGVKTVGIGRGFEFYAISESFQLCFCRCCHSCFCLTTTSNMSTFLLAAAILAAQVSSD